MSSKYEEYFENNKIAIATGNLDATANELIQSKYYARLKSRYARVKKKWDRDFVNYMISKIKEGNSPRPVPDSDSPSHYFDVTITNGQDCLLRISSMLPTLQKKIIPWEDSFELIWKLHQYPSHVGTKAMLERLRCNKRYYLSAKTAEVICEVCYLCRLDKKPNILTSLYLIDMQPNKDTIYNRILVYDDLQTGFIHLVPVSVADSEGHEIALELMKIFMDFGPPLIIQVYEDFPTFKKILESVQKAMVVPNNITLRLNEMQGNDQRLAQIHMEIKDWSATEERGIWVGMCYRLQWKINNTVHGDNDRTPYEMVFGAKKSLLNCPADRDSGEGTWGNYDDNVEELVLDDDSIPDYMMPTD